MPYIIDGHNLIGQLPDISLDDPNDEAKLVQKLAGYMARIKNTCTVVFDHGLPGGKSRMSTAAVKVQFASQRSNADRVIIEKIRKAKNPKIWTIVTSDQEVINEARRYGMNTVTGQQFAQHMMRPPPVEKPGLDTAVDVRLSADEVDEWLQVFKRKRK